MTNRLQRESRNSASLIENTRREKRLTYSNKRNVFSLFVLSTSATLRFYFFFLYANLSNTSDTLRYMQEAFRTHTLSRTRKLGKRPRQPIYDKKYGNGESESKRDKTKAFGQVCVYAYTHRQAMSLSFSFFQLKKALVSWTRFFLRSFCFTLKYKVRYKVFSWSFCNSSQRASNP